MERSGNENKSKSSEDGGSASSKESGSRSSSKEKHKSSSSASKEKESEKSASKTSHSRSSKAESSSKSHQKSSSKSKDDKGIPKSGEDSQKASSSHRSSAKEESKSSHSKHKTGETKHSDSKSSHRSSKEKSESSKEKSESSKEKSESSKEKSESSKEKSESSSKQTHRSSSKDDGKSSSRHGHRSSDHKHSSSSSKVAGGESKAKHSENLPAKDILKVNPTVSSDNKSSRSHASHKDSELPSGEEPKSSKSHEHTKSHSSSDSKSREPSKHSHRSSSKSDKSKDKSHKDPKKSDSQRSHREKSDSKSTKPDEETSTKNSGTINPPPATTTSKQRPSSQTNPLPPPEAKPIEKDRSKSKTSSGAPVEIVATPQSAAHSEKSSTTKSLFSSKNQAPKSDKIVYSREGTKPDSKLRTGKPDLPVSGTPSGKKPHRQELSNVKRQIPSSGKETVKRARSSPSSADPRDSKRSKLDVPEKTLRQEGSLADSAKKGSKKDISVAGAKSDLYVSVKLAAIKKNVPAGKFQVEGLTAKGRSSNRSPVKKKVRFGGVHKIYIERRKKVRFAKVAATYKWPMSRKVKFVKLKKSVDSTNSKKTHKHKLLPPCDKHHKKKITGKKAEGNKEIPSSKKSISWQEKHKTQKSHTGKSEKTKSLTPSKKVKSNDPEKIVKIPKKIKSSPTDKPKPPSLDNALQEKCKQQNKVKESNDNSKPKTEKILPSTTKTSKTEKSRKPSVSEIKLKKKSSSKRKAVSKKSRGSKKVLKGKSKKASKSTVKPILIGKRSVLWKIPKNLSVKKLKVALLKKIQKRSVYLIQIKKLMRVVKIEKAIRKLVGSVNKLTKPKDLLKIQKEIKRLIKIKSGLIKLNKVFDKKLIKRARKAKRIKKKGMLKKKKSNPKKKSVQSAKLLVKGGKKKKKSTKSSKKKPIKKSGKTASTTDKKDKSNKKPVKSSKAIPKLPKSKVKETKPKIVKKLKTSALGSQAGPSEKKASKPNKKKDRVSHKAKKKSVSDKSKVVAEKSKKSSKVSTVSKSKSKTLHAKTAKRKGTVKKVKTKVAPRSCWKSKKTSKEIKRCIRKLHENFYTAKNKGVAQKKRIRKRTRSERKIESKKCRVRKLSFKIKQMQRLLQQHKNSKVLGRKQLINFANNKRLKPFSVRGKSKNKSPNFKGMLLSQSNKKLKNLDCAHFRMIHDTQNVCVVKSWGKMSQNKSNEIASMPTKIVKALKRLNSYHVQCFRQVSNAKFTIMSSLDDSAKPFHLNSEEIYPQLSGYQTAIQATRPNGFGYFFYPDASSMQIEKITNKDFTSKSEIILFNKTVNLSCTMKTSKKSMLQSLIKKKQFPFEKVKLGPTHRSVLGVFNRTKCQNAVKNRKLIPSSKTLSVRLHRKTQKLVTKTAPGKKSMKKKLPLGKLTTKSCKRKLKKTQKSSGRKGSVLFKRLVAPSKRRVLCQKVLVLQRRSSQSTSKSSLKPGKLSLKSGKKKLKTSRSKRTFRKKPSYQWFLRRETIFMGHDYFLVAKREMPKSQWVVRLKQIEDGSLRFFLVKKKTQPRLTLLKSPYNETVKLISTEDLDEHGEKHSRNIGNITNRKKSSGLKTRRTKQKTFIVKRVSTPGKNDRILVRRKPDPGNVLRRQQVLQGLKKPRILIKKRVDGGGRTQLVVYFESIPGKPGKVIKSKVYGPGVKPKVFVQKALEGGQKPRIVLTTQTGLSSTQNNLNLLQQQIGCRFVESKEKTIVIRRELFPGKVIRIGKPFDSSLCASKSNSKLFVLNDWPTMPQPLIIKREWSFKNKTQYTVNRQSLLGLPSRFVVQRGNKTQRMVVKMLIPGKKPQILLTKVLVSEGDSCNIPLQQRSSNQSSDNLLNKTPFGKVMSKTPVVVRKCSLTSPPPFLIIDKPVAPGQKTQILVRREYAEKYNPLVLITEPIPGQKPQIIIRPQNPELNANKMQIISPSSLPQKSQLLGGSQKFSKLAKRCNRIIPKRWSSFHYTKLFSRKQICRRIKKKISRKKKALRKTFKIFAKRSRVLTNALLKQYRLQKRRKRRKRAKRKLRKRQKYPSTVRASKLRYAKQPKLKSTKNRKKSKGQIPSILVQNAKTVGKGSSLQISRKVISRNSTSVCILVKQMQHGQKPQIIIRRLPKRHLKRHKRHRKVTTSRRIEKRLYSSLFKKKKKLRKSGKKMIGAPLSEQNDDNIEISLFANNLTAKPFVHRKIQPPKTIQRVIMKSVAVGSPRDMNNMDRTFDEMTGSYNPLPETKKPEFVQQERTLVRDLKNEQLQQSSTPKSIQPAKRKVSPVNISPNIQVSKKPRTSIKETMKKPLKRINKQKDTRKRKMPFLYKEFPFLLGNVAAKISADNLKRIASRKKKSKGKNIFKVPKIPPRKRESLPFQSESTTLKEKLANTFIAPKTTLAGTSDTTTANKDVRKVPSVTTHLTTADHISNWQAYKDRPKFLFENKDGKAIFEPRKKPVLQNMETVPISSGISSVTSTRKALCNVLGYDAETLKHVRSFKDTDCLTDEEKRLLAAGLTGYPSKSRRPRTPPEPVPAIWAVPRRPRFPKTTVTSLLEQIARKNAAMNGEMDTSDNGETDRDEFPPIINEDLSDDDDDDEKIEDEIPNPLKERHSISNILQRKRFVLTTTSPTLTKLNTQKIFTEFSDVPAADCKIERPIPAAEVPRACSPPSPVIERSGKQRAVVSRGTEIDSALTSPEDMDSDSNIFNENSPTDQDNSGVFKEEPIFSIRELENDFFIESTTNVGTQFDKLIYKSIPKEGYRKLPANVILPPVLIRHKISSFQRSVQRFKQNKIYKIAAFARKRAQKLALRKKLLRKKATLQLKKAKLAQPNKEIQSKSKVKVAPGSKGKKVKKKVLKSVLKVGSKKKQTAAVKPASSISKKTTDKTTPPKIVLKSILKKPSFGMRRRLKVAPLKPLPKDFVLKSILKKKRVNPSHPGVARESSTDAKIPAPVKTAKKKVVISSILSPVPAHNDRKHSRCKHFKGLKMSKVSKSSVPPGPVPGPSRPAESSKRVESSYRREGQASGSSSSSVAGCSKDVPSALPRIQATSTVFKVPAIPPASPKVRTNFPASGGSSSSSSSPTPSSSTYIAPQMPTPSELSLSGILSGSFKVPETPPVNESLKRRHPSSSSASVSNSKRRKHSSPVVKTKTPIPPSQSKVAEHSPGYSSITLASLLKSSEFPVSKDSSHFKPLFDFSSKSASQSEPKSKSQSSAKNVTVQKPQDPIAEVKRISVPTKAQLKQVSPQPQNAESKTVESGNKTIGKDTKKVTSKAVQSKSDSTKGAKGENPKDKIPTTPAEKEKEAPKVTPSKPPCQTKKVSFDTQTSLIDATGKTRKGNLIEHSTTKSAKKGKKIVVSKKKKGKKNLRKCGHPWRKTRKPKKKIRKVAKKPRPSPTLTAKTAPTPTAKTSPTPTAKTVPISKTAPIPTAKTAPTLTAKTATFRIAKMAPTAKTASIPTGKTAPTAKTASILAGKSAPTHTAKTAPIPTGKTAPTSTAKSASIPAGKTAPTTTAKTAPILTAKTAPILTAKTAPILTAKTAPILTAKTAPILTGKTAPTHTAKTAPILTGKTAPTHTAKTAPIPTGKTAPTPTAKTAPIPTRKTAPTPTGKTAPTPTAKTAPIPTGKTAPTPTAKTAPIPTAKTVKKVNQKKPEFKKPLTKAQFIMLKKIHLAQLKFEKMMNPPQKKEGPKYKVKYKKRKSPSLTTNRLRVLISLYSKYEQVVTSVRKIQKEQRIVTPSQNVSKIDCPNFVRESHYWKKTQRSTKFIRKLGLSNQKYFEGTKKIMAKATCNKLRIAFNTSQLLAQKVLKKYGVKKILSTKISKRSKRHSSQTGVLSTLRKSNLRKKKSRKRVTVKKPRKSDGKSKIAAKGSVDRKSGEKAKAKVVAKKSALPKGTPNVSKKIKPDKQKAAKPRKEKVIKKSGKIAEKKTTKQKPLKLGTAKIQTTKRGKKTSRISSKSKTIVKKTRKSRVSKKVKNSDHKLRLLEHKGKLVPVPLSDEKHKTLSTLFVPQKHGSNPNMDMPKPYVVVPKKLMTALNRLGKTVHKTENTGIIKDWTSFMIRTFKKPPPPRTIKKCEMIAKVPTNAYIMHSIQLQRHKRDLDDRIVDLKEKGLAMKIGPMPKLPPAPKGFVEEETTPMDRAAVEHAITQRLCLSIAHGGFTHSTTNALSVLSSAVQQFYRNFCKNLKETVHRNNSHYSIGFPDAMDRVLTEKGFGGVRGLEDYYNTEIMARHKSLQNIAAMKRVEYASILRHSIGLPSHIPVTPEDLAESELSTVEPTPSTSAEDKLDRSPKNEELVWENPNQLPGDRDILELIYDLETDVLKSSQNILCHEVLRPRFLEYIEPSDTPQTKLEIITLPTSVNRSPLVEDKCVGDRGKGTNNENLTNPKEGPDKQGAQPTNWLLAHALSKLTVAETHLFAQWRRMAATLKHSATVKPTVMVMGKEVPTSSLTSEQTLFAKAIEIKSRLQMTLRNLGNKQNIAKCLDPKVVQFLRMAEVARKVVLIARQAKLQVALARRDPNLRPPNIGEGKIVNQTGSAALKRNVAGPPSSQRSNAPTLTAVPIPGTSKGVVGTSNWTFQRPMTNVRPQTRVETQTSPSIPLPRNASPAQIKARQDLLQRAKQLADLPGTSSAAMKEANERLKMLRSFGYKTSIPNPQPSSSKTSSSPGKTGAKGKQKLLSQAGKAKRQKILTKRTGFRASKQSLLKHKDKKPKFKKEKSIETKRVNLLFKISTFIQKLPPETRNTALTRNPNLIRVLRNENCLHEVLKQHPKLAGVLKSPRRKTFFDRRSGYASFMALRRNQVKVYDREARKMKIAILRRKQWKSISKKRKSHKIKTLKRNQGVHRHPITRKRKYVRVSTKNVQVTGINKRRMKVVYPKSSTEKNVFINPSPVATTSRPKSKATKLKSNQTRITDVNRNDSKIISMQRGIVLRRRDSVYQAPSNKVTVFDKNTGRQKLLHLTINQVAVINPLTRKIKVRDLKSNEAKILDPFTKKTQLVMLGSNQIKTYDEKSNTVRIISFQEEKVLDPKTLESKPLKLKPHEVTVVNPVTKAVKIVGIGNLKPVHSQAMNVERNKRVQNDCLRLNPASLKQRKLPPGRFPQKRVKPSDGRAKVPSKPASGLFKSPIVARPATPVSHHPGKKQEVKKRVAVPTVPESQAKSVDRYLKLSRTRAYVESLPTPPSVPSRAPSVPTVKKLSTAAAPRPTDPPLLTVEPRSDLPIRKPLVGEAAGKAVNVLPIHPSTSLLRPINPNLPQFSKTSLIQVGPNSNSGKVGTSLSTRELPSSSKSFSQDIPLIGPSGYKTQQSTPGIFNAPQIIQANVLTKTQPLKPDGSGTPTMVAFTSPRPTYGYSPDIFNLKTGGGVTASQLPLTPLHPMLTTTRISQSLPSDSSTQNLKVAYRAPQGSMAPIIPHSSLTIISSAEHALMFDTSKQSNLSQTKIAFSSSSVLGRPVHGPTQADSVLYNLSPTKDDRKSEKSTARPSSSATSSSLKSSSRYPETSSTKSSKTSKSSSSSRPSESSKSSRSTKEKDKSSSRTSESKSSSSGSSKSSSKHHESKHSSSSSKSHRDASVDPKKSKHYKSQEVVSPEPKQPAKRGRPPKRPAPTTPPKKGKGSRPESTDESVSSRKHAKYH